jgi:hypothetical protein
MGTDHICTLLPENTAHDTQAVAREEYDGRMAEAVYFVKGGSAKRQSVRFDGAVWPRDAAQLVAESLGGAFQPASEAEQQRLGRQPGGTGEGPGGQCVCPSCGHTQEHAVGEACNQTKCAECGALMERAGASETDRAELLQGLAESDESEGLREAGVIQPTQPQASDREGVAGISEGCVLLSSGLNKSGSRYYTPEFLQHELPRFDGALGHADHPSTDEARSRPERTIRTLATVVKSPRYDATQKAVIGDVEFIDNDAGRAMMETYRHPSVRQQAGLSIYWPHRVRSERRVMGESNTAVSVPLELIGSSDEKLSVDCVTRPNAGGRIGPIRESEKEEIEMDMKTLTVAELKAERPDLVEQLNAAPVEVEEPEKDKPTPEAVAATEEQPTESDRIAVLEKRNRQLEAQGIVREAVSEAKLSESARKLVEADFAEAECEDAEAFGKRVAGRIEAVGALVTEAAGSGRVRGVMAEGNIGGHANNAVREAAQRLTGTVPQDEAE